MTPNLIYLQILAYTGLILMILSPLLQIRKTIKQKNGEQISFGMWSTLFIGEMCLLVLFTLTSETLSAIFLTIAAMESIIMMYLFMKYRKKELPPDLSAREKVSDPEQMKEKELETKESPQPEKHHHTPNDSTKL